VATSKLKILYANDGDSLYDEMFISHLLERGHEVHLFTMVNECNYDRHHNYILRQFSRTVNLTGLAVHRRPFGQANPALVVLMLRSLLHRIKPDVLVGNYLQSYGLYSAAALYHPFVAVAWGSDVLVSPAISVMGRMKARLCVMCADFVVVNSQIQRRAVVQLGCDPGKIECFPWCVDLQKFNPSADGSLMRIKFGFRENDFVVLCSRDHEKIYGIEYLVKAIPLVLMKLPRAKFLILGEGTETAALKQLAKELGVGHSVYFVGNVPHSVMPQYVSASNVYISPSLSDGTSASLLEAMACQKPVIASDIPGNREWLDNEKSGLLVEPKNSVAIAEAIISLGLNPKIAEAYAREASRVAGSGANLKEGLARYERILIRASNKRC